MTTIEDRMTMGERYSSATESSNLKLGERRGDVDIIIAAGLVPDGLGPALYRLQAEFTCVRPVLEAARKWSAKQHQMAQALRQQAERSLVGIWTAAEEIEQRRLAAAQVAAAEALEKAAAASVRTEFALALSQMKSLREVRDRWAGYAITLATRAKLMRTDKVVTQIAGRVLDAWLDPRCVHCNGRGFTGASHRGEKEVHCKPCRGVGDRRASIGNDDTERNFAGRLMMELDGLLANSQREIRRQLSAVEKVKAILAEADG